MREKIQEREIEATVRTFAWEWAQTKVRRGSLEPSCTDPAAFSKCTTNGDTNDTNASTNTNADTNTKYVQIQMFRQKSELALLKGTDAAFSKYTITQAPIIHHVMAMHC